MWYFAWVLGIGFAVLLAILNALWGENEDAREALDRQTREQRLEEGVRDKVAAQHGHTGQV